MHRTLDTTLAVALAAAESSTVLAGSPSSGAHPLMALGGTEIGVWEMTPGTVTDVEADEVFVVLSGSATLAFDDGEVIALRPGVSVRLHAGDRTVWNVAETLRKLYLA